MFYFVGQCKCPPINLKYEKLMAKKLCFSNNKKYLEINIHHPIRTFDVSPPGGTAPRRKTEAQSFPTIVQVYATYGPSIELNVGKSIELLTVDLSF